MDKSENRRLWIENSSKLRISMQEGSGALFCGYGLENGMNADTDMGLDADSVISPYDKWLAAVYEPSEGNGERECRNFDFMLAVNGKMTINAKDKVNDKVNEIVNDIVTDTYNDLCFTAQCANVVIDGVWKPYDWGFELKATVKNIGEGFINSVKFRFGGLKMPLDAVFAMPHGAGFFVPVSDLAENESIPTHYPVFCSMQWMELFTDNRGIYMGVCDEAPRSKIFTAGMYQNSPFMEVRFTDLHLKTHEYYELPPLHLMVHEGDWRTGAAHYRGWFESVFTKPDVPKWCLDLPVWAWALCKQQGADIPDIPFNQLPSHRNSFARYGISTLQISGYQENGHDTLYPDYEAGASLGGEEGLRASMRQIHEEGGRLSLYTNGRLADPASDISRQDNWGNWCVSGYSLDYLKIMNAELRFGVENPSLHAAAWDVAGTCYKERYGQVEFAVMCPSSCQWKTFFIGKVVELAQNFRPDGIYLDQVCGAWGLACDNPGHGHEHPCDAWCGYTELLQEMRSRIKEINPETYLATEGVNDILGINIDIFQAHNWEFRFGLPPCAKPAPEIFICTLPKYLLYLGPVFKNDYLELRRAFAYGRGLDIAIENVADCEAEFVRELDFAVKSRQLTCPDLLRAMPQPLQVGAGICCFQFMLPGNHPVVLGSVLGDATQAPREVRMPILKEFAGCRVCVSTPYGEMHDEGDMEITIDRYAGLWMITRERMELDF